MTERFAIPEGWVARGWPIEVDAATSDQRSLIQRHFGARRFAYSWALAQVKANLDTRSADPSVPPLAWTLPTLRKASNQAKAEVAPWWSCCSKEAYASGIADLTTALNAWTASEHGRRAGPRVGFPQFKARHRDRGRVRFTTGAMRLEPDRRHVVLPVIGRLRSKENTRRLERLVARGQARVLSMTLSEQGGRLFVSVATIVAHTPRRPSEPRGRCGIDLGIGTEWAVIAHTDDTIERIAHPAPWAAAQRQHRRIARQLSRRTVGSRGYRQTRAKLATLDRRAANLRRESIHTLTTRLARRYGTIVRHRGLGHCWDGPRHGPADVPAQCVPGRDRPGPPYPRLQDQLDWRRLVVADRWFASSKTHHGCGGYRSDLRLADRRWACPRCGHVVDRNTNAARNLRDRTGPVADRDIQRGGVAAPVPPVGNHGGQAHASAWACEVPEAHQEVAGACDTRTDPPIAGATNPE
jgi:putative transposase